MKIMATVGGLTTDRRPDLLNNIPIIESSSLTESDTGKISQQEILSDGTVLGLKDVKYANEPDLTYFCTPCQRFIKLLSFRDHKEYHHALQILGFEPGQKPRNAKVLLERRNQYIKDIKGELLVRGKTVDINLLELIDSAYERLKQDIEDTFDSSRKVQDKIAYNVEGFGYESSLGFVSSLGSCSNQNSRWKSIMEDCKVYQDVYSDDSKKSFIGIYDGYNGRYAAEVAANELHYILLNEMSKFDKSSNCKCTYNILEENDISRYDLIRPLSPPINSLVHRDTVNPVCRIIYKCDGSISEANTLSSHHPLKKQPDVEGKSSPTFTMREVSIAKNMKTAFKESYRLLDEVLAFGGDENSRVRWSGCSALTVVVEALNSGSNSSTGESEAKYVKSTKEQKDAENPGAKNIDPPVEVGQIHLANCGNCHAVLVRGNRSYLLTKSHSFDNEKEKMRIESLGGVFSQSEKEMRVNGVLLTTRGLGNHGDPNMKKLITWEPHCKTVPIDQYCQMLILASAGVWQVFSPQEAADMLLQVLPQNRMPTPGYVSPSIDLLVTSKEAKKSKHAGSAKAAGPASIYENTVHTPDTSDRNDDVFSENPIGCEGVEEEHHDTNNEKKSVDSGNDADVDTDWGSTVAADGTSRLSHTSRVSNQRHLSKLLAERLVQSALLAGSKENITAIVVLLPGIKLDDG